MIHDGVCPRGRTFVAIGNDDIEELCIVASGDVEVNRARPGIAHDWIRCVWNGHILPSGGRLLLAFEIPDMSSCSKKLGECFIEADDSSDELHIRAVLENGIIVVVSYQ